MPRHLRRVDTPGKLLDRILGTPQLARAVPRLQPEVLHRLIQHCGLEDSGELLALATPAQLTRVFDLDLWRAGAPGLDERFDADRFGRWLEVMVEAGVSGAAATLASMDEALLAAAFAGHVRVFDYAAVAPYVTLDGELSPGASFAAGVRCEIGGYVVQAKRTDFWDAITTVLNALADAHAAAFDRVMRGCCRVSSSRPEIDALDDRLTLDEQAMFDVARDREARSDAQGYVTPAQARAFLQASRVIDLRGPALPARDAVTRAYFRDVEAAAATRREVESSPPTRSVAAESTPRATADAVLAIVELLRDAGVLPRDAHALLELPRKTTPEATTPPRLARVRALLECTHDRDPGAFATRNTELAYLANVVAAGATIQSRPVGPEEASEAVMAVCNLGLEMWPARWRPAEPTPEEFLIHHDLVRVFQVGWTVLHEDVCMYAADRLVSMLASLRVIDSHVQDGIVTLRAKLMRHIRNGAPWDAREALDVIAVLDTPAWAALAALIDQLPTRHAALDASLTGATHRIDPSAFEFISEAAHIQLVRDFMRVVPDRLRA
jgi:hypothetical protein